MAGAEDFASGSHPPPEVLSSSKEGGGSQQQPHPALLGLCPAALEPRDPGWGRAATVLLKQRKPFSPQQAPWPLLRRPWPMRPPHLVEEGRLQHEAVRILPTVPCWEESLLCYFTVTRQSSVASSKSRYSIARHR